MSIKLMNMAWQIALNGPIEKLVLLKICDNANDLGKKSFPSVRTIARTCCCSPNSVTKYVSYLESQRLIRVKRRTTKSGRNAVNHYEVNIPRLTKLFEECCRKDCDIVTSVTPDDTPCVKLDDSLSQPLGHNHSNHPLTTSLDGEKRDLEEVALNESASFREEEQQGEEEDCPF